MQQAQVEEEVNQRKQNIEPELSKTLMPFQVEGVEFAFQRQVIK